MLQPQLYTFLKVCETGSFSRASEALFLTPSAVLHQMRSLEQELGVGLFVRSSKGVALTPQGEFLRERCLKLTRECEELRRDIQTIGVENKTICIGTSLMERCRLLYDLWILFSAEEKDCEIQMLNIDIWHNIPERTDLIESVNSEVPWQRDWRFLEICKVPFGFAFPHAHPLAARSVIRLEDLRGEQVVTINEGQLRGDHGHRLAAEGKRRRLRLPRQPGAQPDGGLRLPQRGTADPALLERYPRQYEGAAL